MGEERVEVFEEVSMAADWVSGLFRIDYWDWGYTDMLRRDL